MIHRGMMTHLKAMKRNDQWLRYMTGKGYGDVEPIGDYKVQYDEDDTDLRIILWNPDTPCMVMVIDKRDKSSVINLIKYDARCTLDGKMERGDGTRKMVNFAIDLLKEKGATSVSLMDESTVNCNGKEIELGPMYFLKHGKTWYERYFGFKPAERFREAYEQAKKMRMERLDIERLANQPCTFFTKDVVKDLFAHIELDEFYRYEWIKHFNSKMKT